MKIALITIKSPYNFGAVLQRFASYEYLRKKGYDIKVIDYFPKKKFRIKVTIKNILTYKRRKKINEFNNRYVKTFQQKYGSYNELESNPPYSDVYIVGSDQVWNSQLSNGRLDPAYFLKFAKHKIKISYASSMGRTDVNEDELYIIKELLQDFSSISVREDSAKIMLNNVGINNIDVVLDPVFLLDKSDYERLIKKVEYSGYILVYSAEKNMIIEELANRLSKERGLKIIEIGTFRPKHTSNKYLQNIGVEDFLSLINSADIVLTTSFHGTAFSVLLNKHFIAVNPSTRGTRLENLVNILHLKDRLVTGDYNYDKLLEPINYIEVNKLVDINSIKSRSFLENAIDSIADKFGR